MIRAAILLALLQLISCQDLPEDWKRCHRNDPNLNRCLKEALDGVIVKLGENGIPSLGVKQIDPLDINEMEVQQKSTSSAIRLKITFRNAKFHGISKSSTIKFDAHLDRYALYGETLTPSLWLEADYIMDGQILVLPVTGKGKCNITMSGVKVLHDIRGKRVERDGDVYMEVENYKTTGTPKRMRGHFSNLFNGDTILGETVNQVINENWQLVFNELKPSLEKTLSGIFLNYANGIFKKVPYDKIFLP